MVLGQVRRAKNACKDNHGQNIPEKLYFFCEIAEYGKS